MAEGDFKIVHFDEYCKTCKNQNEPETNEKCRECLEEPVNVDSHKPIKWEEK